MNKFTLGLALVLSAVVFIGASADQSLFPSPAATEEALSGFIGRRAAVYNGWLRDADSRMTARLTVRTGKITQKGLCPVSVSLKATADGRESALSGEIDVATGKIIGRNAEKLDGLRIGARGIGGSLPGLGIVEGAVDGVAAKDPVIVNAAKPFRLNTYVAAVVDDQDGITTMAVSFTSKGVATVKLRLPDGTSATVSDALVIGDRRACLPVVYAKGRRSFATLLWFNLTSYAYEGMDGTREIVLQKEHRLPVYADGASNLPPDEVEKQVFVDTEGIIAAFPDAIAEFLPGSKIVVTVGRKWFVSPKVGVIGYDAEADAFVPTTDNPSGFRLSYAVKTGEFKGNFRIFFPKERHGLKSSNATFEGVYVGGIGYGMVTVRNVGTWPILIK